MRTFLITLARENTLTDFLNGISGLQRQKSILIQGRDESDVNDEIKTFKAKETEYSDFETVKIQDWDALRQAQTMANVQWILDR